MNKELFSAMSALSLGSLLFITGIQKVEASSYQLFEQNVSSLGYAYAGTAASAQDASTAFYNPAGLTLLNYPELVIGALGLNLDVNGVVKSATSNPLVGLPFDLPPADVQGHADVYPGSWNLVPDIHLAFPKYHWAALGLSITAPYGLNTAYPGDSQVKYLATLTKLTVIDVSPTLGIQLNPQFSVGGGINLQNAKAQLNQKIPVGEALPAFPFGGPYPDGDFRNQLRDRKIVYGWNLGAMYQYCHTRVGVDYRSRVRHHLTGNANLDLPTPLPSSVGRVRATLDLPETANVSFYQDINCQWALLASLDYTHWSLIDKIILNYSGPISDSIETVSLDLNFQDTFRYALGTHFKPCPKWKLKGGVAYDETPVRSAEDRTLRVPDNNRFWVAFGVQYEISPCFVVDAGYSHLFVRHYTADQNKEINLATGGVLFSQVLADFDSAINIVGIQLTWRII